MRGVARGCSGCRPLPGCPAVVHHGWGNHAGCAWLRVSAAVARPQLARQPLWVLLRRTVSRAELGIFRRPSPLAEPAPPREQLLSDLLRFGGSSRLRAHRLGHLTSGCFRPVSAAASIYAPTVPKYLILRDSRSAIFTSGRSGLHPACCFGRAVRLFPIHKALWGIPYRCHGLACVWATATWTDTSASRILR